MRYKDKATIKQVTNHQNKPETNYYGQNMTNRQKQRMRERLLKDFRLKVTDKIWWDSLNDNDKTEVAYEYIRSYPKKNSWAITLSELLNVNCINLAESGGSIQECVFNLKLVEQKITTDDYVFLGLPPIPRLFFIGNHLANPERVMLANMHGNKRWDTLIPFYPDNQLNKEYFNAIDDIIRICRCRGVKLFILPAYTEIHSVSEKLAEKKIKLQHSEFYHKLLDFFSEIENKISEYYIDIPLIKFQYDFLPLCGYYHPNIECHRAYGIEVYKHLKENKYV